MADHIKLSPHECSILLEALDRFVKETDTALAKGSRAIEVGRQIEAEMELAAKLKSLIDSTSGKAPEIIVTVRR